MKDRREILLVVALLIVVGAVALVAARNTAQILDRLDRTKGIAK